MTREELQVRLAEMEPSLVFEEGGDWLNLYVEPALWPALAQNLRADEGLLFDYMFCLTCVDWKTHLTMVYHLSSTRYRHNIVVKSKLNRENPEIETICHIWRTAEFHEREVYDLFGIKFNNHPDLRRLLLEDDWVGFPLRKDYKDEANIVEL